MAEDKKAKPKPIYKSYCTCTSLLYILAVIGIILAGAYYYVHYGCDLSNEHEEMDCSEIFRMKTLPMFFQWSIEWTQLLDSWGILDFKMSIRRSFDSMNVNTTHLFNTPNITNLSILVQEWEHNGYNLYSYTPNELVGVSNQPVVIHLHGGGGVLFSPKYFDFTIRYLANSYKIKFIVPDYPKSPEVVFPTVHEFCLNAVKHVFENSKKFSIDPKRVSITGDSFGGHAGLYVSFKWRELGYYKKYAPILTLSLVYPWVQFVNTNLDSYRDSNNNNRLLSVRSIATFASFLINGSLDLTDLIINQSLPKMSPNYKERQLAFPELLPKIDWEPPQSMIEKYASSADTIIDPYTCFLFQTDFSHLPPIYVISAGYDLLLSESIMLIQRMNESGVQVEHYVAEKMFHGFFAISKPMKTYSETFIGFEKLGKFLKKHNK
ncbi:hypothetical protein LOD99_1416 [Oopsacas minuta]|uniref:Alpha/beta hydrolase fold-3 domain-containing protein n=1 Tax=Oopsacas minuta TaxID=111878 RepID=A0AAV7K8P2_9METZ|nr:hypothetical protein LOD99_1416 [Oopsacas minuta]